MQVRRVTQRKDRGRHQVASIPHKHFLHDHSPFLRFDHICVKISPSTGSSGSSTGSYMPFTGRSYRTFRQARIDLGRESEGWNLPVRPANTPVSIHHYISPCFISLHLRCTHPVICSCTVTQKTLFSSYCQQELLVTNQAVVSHSPYLSISICTPH